MPLQAKIFRMILNLSTLSHGKEFEIEKEAVRMKRISLDAVNARMSILSMACFKYKDTLASTKKL